MKSTKHNFNSKVPFIYSTTKPSKSPMSGLPKQNNTQRPVCLKKVMSTYQHYSLNLTKQMELK